jgi:hypothetical protein
MQEHPSQAGLERKQRSNEKDDWYIKLQRAVSNLFQEHHENNIRPLVIIDKKRWNIHPNC